MGWLRRIEPYRAIWLLVCAPVACTSAGSPPGDSSVDVPSELDASGRDTTLSSDRIAADRIFDRREADRALRDRSIDLAKQIVDGSSKPPPDQGPVKVCSAVSPTTGVFDSSCIYLIGTLLPGAAGNDVVVHPKMPNDYSWGFGYYAAGGIIRPKDGLLVFTDNNGEYRIFGFHPDSKPTGLADPKLMLSNDTVISTPACALGAYRAYVFPDDSAVAYRCFTDYAHPNDGNKLYLEGQTSPLVDGGTLSPFALGPKRTVLLADKGKLAVFSSGKIVMATQVGPFQQALAARFVGQSFLVAVARSFSPTSVDLLQLSQTAVATSLGSYQLGTTTSYFDDCKLEPAGALQCFAYNGSADLIVRFTTSSPPTIVYDESKSPVQIHISSLFTGP